MRSLLATLRPLRTELIGAAGMFALLALAAGGIALRLALLGIPAQCWGVGATGACVAFEYDMAVYQSIAGQWLTALAFGAGLVPAVAGVLFGIAAVGKELDQRTAVLAWSVSPSRRRWLLQRVSPLLGLLALLGLGCSQLVLALLRVRSPELGEVPDDFGAIPFVAFGPAASGVSTFGITVLIGALLGRLLPAVLGAGALVILAFVLVGQVNQGAMAGESLVAELSMQGQGPAIDSFLRAPDGRFISWNEAYPDYVDPDSGEPVAGVTQMVRYVPIEIYPQVAARYLLLHVALGLAALVIAFAVVERKSP